MSAIIEKLRRSITNDGLLGTTHLILRKASSLLKPSYWEARHQARAKDLEFDRTYSVDTGGTFFPGSKDVSGSNWQHGIKYQPITPEDFLEALQGLNIEYQKFTFVDFGSGKGRAILLATRFPFKRIIGVEYSESLNEIARQNLLSWQKSEERISKVEIVWADACDFLIPSGPLVLYFYNPFTEAVMEKVVHNIAKSLVAEPRPVLVVYFCARHAELLDRLPSLSRIQKSSWMAVYDSRLESNRKSTGLSV